MKRLISYISALFFVFTFTLASAENKVLDTLWQAGNDNYAMANFNAAIENFTAINENGYESAKLYYNLANSYYRNKEIGKSVLYYKKALKLDPSFSDAKANLAMAKARCVDKIDKVPEFMVVTWVKNIRNKLSSNAWAMLAIVLLALALILFLLLKFYWRGVAAKVAFVISIFLILLMLISLSFSISLYHRATLTNEGVVVSSVGGVKSSPSNDGNPIFILHEGSEFEILESVEGWCKIEIADGRQGWIKSSDIEVV